MPELHAPHQSVTATRPRLSGNGSAPPLPAEIAHPQRPARPRMAITRLRGVIRRIVRRPQPR